MTASAPVCAHTARTDARGIFGTVRLSANASGMPDLHFRDFENVRIHSRHAGKETANAVWE